MITPTAFSPYHLRSILSLLLTDENYRETFFYILKPEHFETDDWMITRVAQAIWKMYDKYGVFPSVDALTDEMFTQKGANIELYFTTPSKDELLALFDFVVDLTEIEIKDRKYVEDNTLRILNFLSIQKVVIDHSAAFKSGLLNVEDFTKDIVAAGTFNIPVNAVIDLYADLDKRTNERISTTITPGLVELNIPEFQRYLEEGGLPPGSLGFILAPTNGGKSSALIHISHDAARDGHKVLYVTAELSEDMIKRRFDACMTHVPISSVKKQAGHVKGIINTSQRFQDTAKNIRIIEVPVGATRVSEIENIVERLRRKGFDTDLLVIDYADNLRSERKAESYRHEVTSIYKDLRAIAMKHHLVVWTASQMNDAGSEQAEKKGGIISTRHVNEARGKIHIADLCVAIARTQEDKDVGQAQLILVKNRLGSGDGTRIGVTTRFDISRLFGLDAHAIPMSSVNLDEPIAGLEGLALPPVPQDKEPVSLADYKNRYGNE